MDPVQATRESAGSARGWRLRSLGCAAAVVALFAVGCGSSDSDSDSGSSGGNSAAADTTADYVKQAEANVKKGYAGTDAALPTAAPKPTPKTVHILSCSQAAAGCANAANAFATAAKEVGWKTKILDGKLDPANYPGLIKSAVASKADAIFTVSVDCPAAKSAFQQAHDAGIKIYAYAAFDCDDEFVNQGEGLFDGELTYTGGDNFGQFVSKTLGAASADWVITKGGGEPEVIMLREDDVYSVKAYATGLKARFDQCSKCKVHVVTATAADYGNGGFLKKATAALARYPTAKFLIPPSDGSLLLGVSQAAKQSGRDVAVVGLDGLKDVIAQIKAGGPAQMIPGLASDWAGWASVDGLNRIFAGEEPVDAGIGYQIVDTENNIPADISLGYNGNVDADGKPKQDYKSNYLKIWGQD